MDNSQQALLRLHLTPGLGRASLFRLKHYFGELSLALSATARQLTEAGLTARQIAAIPSATESNYLRTRKQLDTLQVRLISFWDPDYPPLLRQIHDPPALLYLRGKLPARDCLAMVGSRRATAGGCQLAHQLASELAAHDICIVSGLARGIDTAAHCGALDVDGTTIAVLGCGIDRIYPADNARLFLRILQQGAVLSEYPPGTPPLAGHFPGRNRIISGLSKGVLIVEAAERSGSLITGDFALEQGRELFATPGAVQAPTSKGVNRLLKDGAVLVTAAADILQELWPQRVSRSQQKAIDRVADQLNGAALETYRLLSHEPLHIDEIGRKCGLTPMEVSAILLDLELQGAVQILPGNCYIRGKSQ